MPAQKNTLICWLNGSMDKVKFLRSLKLEMMDNGLLLHLLISHNNILSKLKRRLELLFSLIMAFY